MAELAALNVKINGDASGLQGALNVAEGGLERVGAQAAQTQRQVAATSTGMSRLGQTFQRNGFAISNAANQFSDLAVQMSMGVPASRALSQQLPQMTAFMGPLATVIGVTAGVLIGLAGNFLAASRDATTYADALDELESITNDVKRASDILDTSMFELTARYGEAAERVRELAVAELQLAVARQRAAVMQAAQSDELQAAISDYGNLTKVVGEMGEVFYDTSSAARAIERDLGVSGQTASELAVSFNALQNALTIEDQIAAWTRIQELFDRAGISLSELPPELASALATVIDLEQGTIDLATALQNAAQQAEGLNQALPQTLGGLGPGLFNADGSIALPPGAPGTDEPPSVLGGGGNLAARIERDLERLREGFMSEEELQIAAFDRQQEILQSALEQRLLTQEEYNDLIRQSEQSHIAAMDALHRASVNQTIGQYDKLFGNMVSIFSAGGDRLVGITKAFSIAQGLLNSYRAFTEVLADPSLIGRPFLRTALAASTLGAGLAQVANMRSIGGGGGGGGASAGVAASAASAAPTQLPTQTLRFDFGGQNTMGMEQIVDLLNDAYDRGYRVRAVMA